MPKKKATKKPKGQTKKGKIPGVKDTTESYIKSLKEQGMLGDITKKINFVPTGAWVLNRIIGDGSHTNSPGGFPRGYITELFGDEGCGKTTIALHACQQAQLIGEKVIYADFEHSLRTQYKYIKNIGVDTSAPKFIHLTPSSLEDGVKEIGRGLLEIKPALIVIDSVTTMLPKATYDSSADETTQIGLHAKLTGTFLNWISKRLEGCDTALLLLNQIRTNIKTKKFERGPKETTSGGRAPKFFSSVRIELRTGQSEKITEKSIVTGIKEEKKINQIVKATVVKNKLDMPWRSGPIYIAFGQGIDNIMSLVNLAINKKVLKGQGWLSFEDPAGKYSFKVQGKMAVKKYLEEHPDALNAMKPYLIPSEDTKEMIKIRDDLESKGLDNLTDDELDTLKRLRELNLDDVDEDDESNLDPDLSEEDLNGLDELNKAMDTKKPKETDAKDED